MCSLFHNLLINKNSKVLKIKISVRLTNLEQCDLSVVFSAQSTMKPFPGGGSFNEASNGSFSKLNDRC